MADAPQPKASDAAARRPRTLLLLGGLAALVAVLGAAAFLLGRSSPAAASMAGVNPHPIKLLRPREQPLSLLAQIGAQLFHDTSLSASGQQSCASCHSPDHAFGPPNHRSVQLGGAHLDSEGLRPPPSLTYLYRQLAFSIGPAVDDNDTPPPMGQLIAAAQNSARAVKSAGAAPAAALVPQGGLFWDGRANALMDQALGPMTNPAEMANKDKYEVARKLERAGYVERLKPLFGNAVVNNPEMLFAEAMSALSAYQIESPAFHCFDSKYDYWLEGKARLTPAEARGLALFNDPAKGNCAACHLSAPGKTGLPPLFTDTEYEALGVPRNRALAVNRDPNFFDLGLCGPARTDLAKQTQYCGMFLTPTLRNAAGRGVYFHNGLYHDLHDVVRFYNLRDVDPGRIYPRDASGKIAKFDDLPPRYRANIDVADAPFDRKPGQRPALTDAEIEDIVAFLQTLDDGYKPQAGN